MPISSVSATSNTPYIASPAPAKAAAETGSSEAAAPSAKPDTDAKTAKSDTDAPAAASTGKPEEKSASAPNMFRINPDGTVGPLHQKRHANASGVVHA